MRQLPLEVSKDHQCDWYNQHFSSVSDQLWAAKSRRIPIARRWLRFESTEAIDTAFDWMLLLRVFESQTQSAIHPRSIQLLNNQMRTSRRVARMCYIKKEVINRSFWCPNTRCSIKILRNTVRNCASATCTCFILWRECTIQCARSRREAH
jgi:hypothetical protein